MAMPALAMPSVITGGKGVRRQRKHQVFDKPDVAARSAFVGPGPGEYLPPETFAQRRVPVWPSNRPLPTRRRGWTPGAPSIPVPDQAWGYEENDSGVLTLQQPERTSKIEDAIGPGFYSPRAEVTMASSPRVDFSLSSGRTRESSFAGPPSATSALAPGEHDGKTENPIPRMAMPTAAFAQVKSKPAWAQSRAIPPPAPPPPGPGAYPDARGVGSTQPVLLFPKQRRHFALSSSPRLPLGRSAMPGVALRVSRAELEPLTPKEPFLRRPVPEEPQTPLSPPAPSNSPSASMFMTQGGAGAARVAADRKGAASGATRDEFSAPPGPPEPTEGRPTGAAARRDWSRLWGVFCLVDANKSGFVSKRELFDALDRTGAKHLGGGGKLKAYLTADADRDGQLDFREFHSLAMRPEFREVIDLAEWHLDDPLVQARVAAATRVESAPSAGDAAPAGGAGQLVRAEMA